MKPYAAPNNNPARPSLLFSYGTLQQGERAEYHLEAAEFLGEVWTVEPFLLVDCGEFPGLVDAPDNPSASSVTGELYAIPDILWPKLDTYEGIQDGDYHRTPILVKDDQGVEKTVEAYIWAREWEDLPVVGSCWKTYRRRHYPLV